MVHLGIRLKYESNISLQFINLVATRKYLDQIIFLNKPYFNYGTDLFLCNFKLTNKKPCEKEPPPRRGIQTAQIYDFTA